MRDANPWLGSDRGTANKGGEHTLERPGEAVNIAWQTRAAPPTDAEARFADALQRILADRVHDLPGIVARLDREGVPAPGGGAWSEASLTAELARLGRA